MKPHPDSNQDPASEGPSSAQQPSSSAFILHPSAFSDHPLAELFPLLPPAALAANIREHGLQAPIVRCPAAQEEATA
jgi:hypothetical protein